MVGHAWDDVTHDTCCLSFDMVRKNSKNNSQVPKEDSLIAPIKICCKKSPSCPDMKENEEVRLLFLHFPTSPLNYTTTAFLLFLCSDEEIILFFHGDLDQEQQFKANLFCLCPC